MRKRYPPAAAGKHSRAWWPLTAGSTCSTPWP